VPQFEVVNVRLEPEDTVMSLSPPEILETDTVLLAVGCNVSLTWKVFVEPSLTVRAVTLVVICTLLTTKFAVIVAAAEAVTVVVAEFAFANVAVPLVTVQFTK
jgi:hypothetical protein